jgi:hypothetical protein
MRKERGEIDNHFVAEANGPDRPWRFYGLNVALTLAAGALVLVIHGVGGVELQTAYYIVILSTLLQHYYLDHLQFTKLGDMVGEGDRLLGAGRAREARRDAREGSSPPRRACRAAKPARAGRAQAAAVAADERALAGPAWRRSCAARKRPSQARARTGPQRRATRSFLVDVHLIDPPASRPRALKCAAAVRSLGPRCVPCPGTWCSSSSPSRSSRRRSGRSATSSATR